MSQKTTEQSIHRHEGMLKLVFLAAFILSLALFTQNARAGQSTQANQKEWTFLLFLNGHNSLDSYGAYNINQMEEVGSSNQLNMVVQWASMGQKTKRLLVQKDSDTNNVTSPVVEALPAVDMGDYKNLIEFVRWGVQKYPAKHYMIAVWNHGNGWHLMSQDGLIHAQDISYDDQTGNHITTEQLGLAMNEAAKIIGHKVDVYGSDACLMAMPEIASEMKSSVQYFVGSEETEPGYGWPYTTFMKRWVAASAPSAADVATFLTEEYIKSYDGGIYGTQDVTFSAYDMSKLDGLNNAIKGLSAQLSNLSPSDMKTTKEAASSTMAFALDDYKDLQDFTSHLESNNVGIHAGVLSTVKQSIKDFVIAGGGTGIYANATGVSVWLPTESYQLDSYKDRYSKLQFNKETGWLNFLQTLVK